MRLRTILDQARMKTSNRILSYTLPKGLNHLWVSFWNSDGLMMLIEKQHARRSPPSIRRSTPTPSQRSDVDIESPPLQSDGGDSNPPYLSIADNSKSSKRFSTSPVSPPPITTSVPPARDWSATPRAQTRSEAEADLLEHERPKNATRSSSLEGKRYRSCIGCIYLSGMDRHP